MRSPAIRGFAVAVLSLTASYTSAFAQEACLPAKTEAAFKSRTPACRHRIACETMRARLPDARKVLLSPSCYKVFGSLRFRDPRGNAMKPEFYYDHLQSGGVCGDHPGLSAEQNLNQTFENSPSRIFISEGCGGGLANGHGKGADGKLCISARDFLFGVSDGLNSTYWSQIQLILHEFGHTVDAIYNENWEAGSVDNQRLVAYHCIAAYSASGKAAYTGPAVGTRP